MSGPRAPSPHTLSAHARAGCAVCADLLATAPWWWALALWGLGGLTVRGLSCGQRVWVAGAALGLLAQVYCSVRVALDARLFARLARPGGGGLADLSVLDHALAPLRGAAAPSGPVRPLQDRLVGAQRWYRRHAGLSVALALLAAAAWGGSGCGP